VELRRAWLASLGWCAEEQEAAPGYEAAFDRLADEVERALDLAMLDRLVWG
jgi:hypothetical protein